jgi:hypothetical protein
MLNRNGATPREMATAAKENIRERKHPQGL